MITKSNGFFAFRPRLFDVFISGMLLQIGTAVATPIDPSVPATVKFDSGSFAFGMGDLADLSRFDKANTVLPGTYRLGIVVNQNWQGLSDVEFSSVSNQGSAMPCFDRAMLTKFGVDLDKVARGDGTRSVTEVIAHQIPANPICGNLNSWIADATVSFDAGEQTLTITIPQIYMNRSARGYVDPALLDSGVTAALLSYNFTSSVSTSGGGGSQSFLGLNGGVNLGDWRLRHQGAQAWNSVTGRTAYQNTATYLQRDFSALKSQLVLGDNFTDGRIMDSIRLRGITLTTDDRQTSQSQQGYAPVVRGTATSNARVVISQGGYTIYETTVAPGPFVIDDLYPTGYGGDLLVTVIETDGRQSRFTVPYSAIPQLLRQGAIKYSVALGQLRQYGGIGGTTPWVMQGSLQRGINNFLTGYGGLTASTGYWQAKVGTAVSMPIGALAIDAAVSSTKIQGYGTLQGQSLQITYNKNISEIGTNFALGASRFSSSGYLGLNDAVSVRNLASRGADTGAVNRQRSRFDWNISQEIGKGSMFISGSSTQYWGRNLGRQTSFSAGYGSNFGKITWSLSAQRIVSQSVQLTPEQMQMQQQANLFYGAGYNSGRSENRIMLSLSMPLGYDSNAPTMNSFMTHNTGSNGGNNLQVGVNGSVGEQRNLSYGVSSSHTSGDSGSSNYFNANVGYLARSGNLSAGFSQSGNSGQVSFNANGGIVAHPGGISLAQSLGDAIGLIEAPDAEGASISSSTGITIDSHGYAVAPYLRPYQNNTIDIDPKGSSDDIQFKETSKTIAPRMGSVIMYKFETDNSRAVTIKALRSDGKPLPFAAEVLNEMQQPVGVVGQGSKAFVRKVSNTGVLTVKWGDGIDQRCQMAYTLPERVKGKDAVSFIESQCYPVTPPAPHGSATTVPKVNATLNQ
ncbi:fimbria/pilus outer membrane usher protein [Collimonas pratensis]|nr:fimbria/pilus outer membrane usher protein [Collimonas pratensis]